MNKNGNFKSTVGFVLACVGSAVGMGNIWMFPYRLGQYGGAAFLIPYLIFIALFSLVGLSAEFALGRMAKTGTLGAYTYCWKNKFGKYIGSITWISWNCDWIQCHFRMGISQHSRCSHKRTTHE